MESDILPTVEAAGVGGPKSAAYGASKAALLHYMKSLSLRVMPTIRVNTVSPGDTFVAGGLRDRVQQNDPEHFKRVMQRNPMQRLATPEEIARWVPLCPALLPALSQGPTGRWMGAPPSMCAYEAEEIFLPGAHGYFVTFACEGRQSAIFLEA